MGLGIHFTDMGGTGIHDFHGCINTHASLHTHMGTVQHPTGTSLDNTICLTHNASDGTHFTSNTDFNVHLHNDVTVGVNSHVNPDGGMGFDGGIGIQF